MKNQNIECKGCRLYDTQFRLIQHSICLSNSFYILEGTKYNCPCLHCLIKSVCRNECEEYDLFKKKYWDTILDISQKGIK